MAANTTQRNPARVKGGSEQLRKLQARINQTVPPYPPIDVHEERSWRKETPKGHVVRTVGRSSMALLASTMLYGMVTHDREIVLAVLEVIKFSVVALLAWASGSVVLRLLPRSKKTHDEDTEHSGDSSG